MPRFTAGIRLRVHLRLGATPILPGGTPNPRNRPVPADVVNVSITGISLAVTGTLRVHCGATVTIGDGDSTAACRVAYTARSAEAGSQILGLEFVSQTDAFRLDVGRIIAALRQDRGQVIAAWHRPN
ncbi:MAG: hypothetical protein RIB98_02520 [Acidimicrobiales bacterium]